MCTEEYILREVNLLNEYLEELVSTFVREGYRNPRRKKNQASQASVFSMNMDYLKQIKYFPHHVIQGRISYLRKYVPIYNLEASPLFWYDRGFCMQQVCDLFNFSMILFLQESKMPVNKILKAFWLWNSFDTKTSTFIFVKLSVFWYTVKR